MAFQNALSLFNTRGERKYLNQKERERFYEGTLDLPLERQLFCQLLYYTGARISEIFELSKQQLDFEEKVVTIRTLKRRRKNVYRQIPLPEHLLNSLQVYIEKLDRRKATAPESLWSFSSRTASRIVKNTMIAANIEGIKASALGLRHGFAVYAVTKVPQTQVQKWMGHAHLTTTAIYLQVSGIEEREMAEKLW